MTYSGMGTTVSRPDLRLVHPPKTERPAPEKLRAPKEPVGEFYKMLEGGFRSLSERLGEKALFIGPLRWLCLPRARPRPSCGVGRRLHEEPRSRRRR